jgi:hypothetical protein
VVIKRLRIIRLPQVVTALIDGWLNLILWVHLWRVP